MCSCTDCDELCAVVLTVLSCVYGTDCLELCCYLVDDLLTVPCSLLCSDSLAYKLELC